jgi:hypothetical protein
MIPEAVYIINCLLLARWNVQLRATNMMSYIDILVNPVIFLYQDFMRFRKQKIYELAITPQVCYLERLLNDRYDLVQRRIVIVDTILQSSKYIYRDDELKPVFFYQDSELQPLYFFSDGETQTSFDDFIVKVPATIVFEVAEMKSLIKQFCLAGKTFKIELV